MPTVCAAQLTARTLTCRLSWPSGETILRGAPTAVLEHVNVIEPDGGVAPVAAVPSAAGGTAHESSFSAGSVASELSEISRNDGSRSVWAATAVESSGAS